MTSRDTSEYLMPSVPIEMPSEMVMVLKRSCSCRRLVVRAGLGFARELVDVHVARRDVAPGGGDADRGFLKSSSL